MYPEGSESAFQAKDSRFKSQLRSHFFSFLRLWFINDYWWTLEYNETSCSQGWFAKKHPNLSLSVLGHLAGLLEKDAKRCKNSIEQDANNRCSLPSDCQNYIHYVEKKKLSRRRPRLCQLEIRNSIWKLYERCIIYLFCCIWASDLFAGEMCGLCKEKIWKFL